MFSRINRFSREIEDVCINDLNKQLFGESDWSQMSHEEVGKILLNWIKENDSEYYVAPREVIEFYKERREDNG